jgi:hypothetical protein
MRVIMSLLATGSLLSAVTSIPEKTAIPARFTGVRWESASTYVGAVSATSLVILPSGKFVLRSPCGVLSGSLTIRIPYRPTTTAEVSGLKEDVQSSCSGTDSDVYSELRALMRGKLCLTRTSNLLGLGCDQPSTVFFTSPEISTGLRHFVGEWSFAAESAVVLEIRRDGEVTAWSDGCKESIYILTPKEGGFDVFGAVAIPLGRCSRNLSEIGQLSSLLRPGGTLRLSRTDDKLNLRFRERTLTLLRRFV